MHFQNIAVRGADPPTRRHHNAELIRGKARSAVASMRPVPDGAENRCRDAPMDAGQIRSAGARLLTGALVGCHVDGA